MTDDSEEIFIDLDEPDPVWAPSPDQVAAVLPAYTRGGFDDDDQQAGAEKGRFTTTTSPTLQHVQDLIELGCDEVAGRVPVDIPENCRSLARMCVIWWVAVEVSTGKLPAQTDDAQGEYSSHTARYLSSLEELIEKAQRPRALRIY